MTPAFKFERRAVLLALFVSLVLMGVKFAAWFVTGSAAIFSDALESIVNVLASSVALWSIIVAHSPADESHPYGHGKVEFLSAAFEGGMMLLAGLAMIANALGHLLRGDAPQQLTLGIALTAASMLVNGVVGWALIRAGRRYGSLALDADGKHVLGDAITSAGVVAALAGVRLTGLSWLDPLGAIAVAAYVCVLALGLLRRSTAGLMDEQDVEDDRLLRSILDAHVGASGAAVEPRICSYHKLRHRHSGRYHWVDFHILVPARLDVRQEHEIASHIEHEIEQALGEGNATAHVEPCTDASCRGCNQKPGVPTVAQRT